MSSFSHAPAPDWQRQPAKPESTASAAPPRVQAKAAAHGCACGGDCPRCKQKQALQTHLSVSQPGDRYEQEADRVAAQVMSNGGSAQAQSAPVQIQRLAGEGASQAVPASVDQALAGSSTPLAPSVRHSMEQRFGHSFADVNVHLDGQAQQSARDIGAEAYTVGRDLVFAAGKYAPDTYAGQHLLAHELTHVLQQTGSGLGAQRMLAPYRSKGKDTIAFEGADETLTDAKTQPWIEHIDVNFNSAVVDSGHVADAKAAGDKLGPRMPKGTLTATYSSKSKTTPSDIVVPVVGGSTMRGIGLTDKVKKQTVKRMEGSGYTDSDNVLAGNLTDPVATSGKGARYSKSGAGTMNYALFFQGAQAIHEGGLDIGSHACVHVEDHNQMRTLNHHTRLKKTTVTVRYAESVLKDLCCTRKKNGNPSWQNNPCNGIECP